MNREQLAWAAGIVDGEGSFLLHRNRHMLANGENRLYTTLTLAATQATDGPVPQMLRRLQNLFGGTINGPTPRLRPARDSYKWTVRAFESTQAVMADIWPWLGEVKKDQAKKMLKDWHSIYDPRRTERYQKTVKGRWTVPRLDLGHDPKTGRFFKIGTQRNGKLVEVGNG